MINDTTTRTAGHPLFRILVSFPIACFVAALATDIAYAFTTNMMWADFSAWLLAGGLGLGVLAAIAGIGAAITDRRRGVRRPYAALTLGSLVVLALGFVDNLVHSRDAWTSVVPLGLILSALTVIVMLLTAWAGSASEAVTVRLVEVRR